MELSRVTTEEQWQFCRELYHTAFNENERRDWDEVVALQQGDNPFTLYTIEREGVILGFISIWTFGDFAYGEHFAISEQSRGGGIGAEVMRIIGTVTGERIVLEVEPPTTDIDARRVGFYERQGFMFTDKPYVQPAYSPLKSALPMNIMTRGQFDIDREFDSIVHTIHREVYGKS